MLDCRVMSAVHFLFRVPVCMYIQSLRGAVAQLGARVNGIHEVAGSIPASSTKHYVFDDYPVVYGETFLYESRSLVAVIEALAGHCDSSPGASPLVVPTNCDPCFN
jgi:hypothetical protein